MIESFLAIGIGEATRQITLQPLSIDPIRPLPSLRRSSYLARGVKVNVQLLPETRLLLALANEEVEARRKAGQSEAKIWRDSQRAPFTFVKAGFKRLLSV